MSESVRVSWGTLTSVAREVYGEEVANQARRFFESYKTNDPLAVFQGFAGDGVVSIAFNPPAKGGLYFHDSGNVYANEIRVTSLPVPFARLFAAAAFGKEELKEIPSGPEGVLFESALEMYQCVSSGKNLEQNCLPNVFAKLSSAKEEIRQKKEEAEVEKIRLLNDQTVANIRLANRMLEKAEKEDAGPGGWDPDDFRDILLTKSALIANMPSNTEKDARARVNESEGMIDAIVETDSGTLACLEFNMCSKSVFTPNCSYDEEVSSQILIKYKGRILETYGTGSCTKRVKEKDYGR